MGMEELLPGSFGQPILYKKDYAFKKPFSISQYYDRDRKKIIESKGKTNQKFYILGKEGLNL